MLLPESNKVPLPILVRPKVPLPSCIVPEKVVLLLSLPTVRTIDPTTEFVTVPDPVSDPILLLKPPKSSVAALALKLTAELLPKALVATPAFRVPPLTVVAPV